MEKVKAYQVTITHRSDETIHLALYDYIDHQTNVAYYYIASKEFDDTNNNILNVRGKVSHATAAKLCSFCLIKDGIPCITEPNYEKIWDLDDPIKVGEKITQILNFEKREIDPLENGDILFITSPDATE